MNVVGLPGGTEQRNHANCFIGIGGVINAFAELRYQCIRLASVYFAAPFLAAVRCVHNFERREPIGGNFPDGSKGNVVRLVGELIGESDNLGHATPMFGEGECATEPGRRDVEKRAFRVGPARFVFVIVQIVVGEFAHVFLPHADGGRRDLFIIADHDNAGREVLQEAGFRPGLRRLVHHHHVKHIALHIQLVNNAVQRHNPHRNSLAAIIQRPANFPQLLVRIFAGSFAQAFHALRVFHQVFAHPGGNAMPAQRVVPCACRREGTHLLVYFLFQQREFFIQLGYIRAWTNIHLLRRAEPVQRGTNSAQPFYHLVAALGGAKVLGKLRRPFG